jgi:hypothetical protein
MDVAGVSAGLSIVGLTAAYGVWRLARPAARTVPAGSTAEPKA